MPIQVPIDTSAQKVTLAQAALHFQVSTKTIRRWISLGLIKAERVGPRLIRVDLESIELRPIGGGSDV